MLYVVDHVFFALALSLKTYIQKIAIRRHRADAAVAFTINHIAAVFLPAALGYLWVNPPAVFILAAGLAASSLCLSMLIPRHPLPGARRPRPRVPSPGGAGRVGAQERRAAW